ncbi:MAG: lipopolysaccharide heptosyltransferase II [Phycisphaerae bacterium]|nr:lipopolysaccharide heptosyltransferase II [Phycisphaerae bacterium]
MSNSPNILVFLPNWVGDAVMATPMLRALRAGMEGAKIVYVARPAIGAVLQGCDWCDEVIPDESKRLRYFPRTIRRLRAVRAETAILLPNSFRGALLARLSGASRRVGYARDGRGWLLTDRLAPPRGPDGRFLPAPMIDYYAELLQPLGLKLGSRTMELPLLPADAQQADALLHEAGYDSQKPLVMLNPGSAFGSSKLWPADRYARAADALADSRGAQILVNAAPNPAERALAAAVAEHMRRKPLLNFARRDNTLGLLKALLRRCDLLITNDTGARHVAAAMGAAVVTIFGSTDPAWTRIDYPAERIVRVDVSCGPCQKKICPLPAEEGRLRCLTGVSVQSVVAAAEELLADRAGGTN